jgi:diaminohydroxyphosphoribosylaminopyrimidine deaminase/5-amino-6-(5-phosphoribosylamino)uracil reductase
MCWQEQHRPYVILKWAQTADGYIDEYRERADDPGQTGGPIVISTPLMKQLVHQQRAENMAIMVGTRTVLLDNPRLLTTHWSGRNPIRITLDRHGILPADSRIFSDEAPTIVYRDNTDWAFVVADLAKRNIHSVLVEGGRALLQHILDTGVYDEVHIEVSDKTLGTADTPADGVKAPDYQRQTKPWIIDNHRVFIERHFNK